MVDLVKIEKMSFGGEMQEVVNARDLHLDLGVSTRFNDWIERRLEKANLIKGKDYWVLLKSEYNSQQRGRPPKEYFLTIDAAKHVALMEGNSKGHEIRQKFIDYEKDTRRMLESMVDNQTMLNAAQNARVAIENDIAIANLLECPLHIAQSEAVKNARLMTGADYSHLLAHAPAQQEIKEEQEMLEPTELGKVLADPPASGRNVNYFLDCIGWQKKKKKTWVATKEGEKYCARHHWVRGNKSGYNYKWNVKAVKEQWEKVKNEN